MILLVNQNWPGTTITELLTVWFFYPYHNVSISESEVATQTGSLLSTPQYHSGSISEVPTLSISIRGVSVSDASLSLSLNVNPDRKTLEDISLSMNIKTLEWPDQNIITMEELSQSQSED